MELLKQMELELKFLWKLTQIEKDKELRNKHLNDYWILYRKYRKQKFYIQEIGA